MISCLDRSKISFISEDHSNFLFLLKNGLKGSISSVSWLLWGTWFTRPNQALLSVVLVGVGYSATARMYLSNSLTSVSVILNPVNSTSGWLNWNLSMFNMIPFWPQRSIQELDYPPPMTLHVIFVVQLKCVVHTLCFTMNVANHFIESTSLPIATRSTTLRSHHDNSK